jgi:hypothetical protein
MVVQHGAGSWLFMLGIIRAWIWRMGHPTLTFLVPLLESILTDSPCQGRPVLVPFSEAVGPARRTDAY